MFNQHDCLTNTPVHIICIYIYIYPFHIKIQRERERERQIVRYSAIKHSFSGKVQERKDFPSRIPPESTTRSEVFNQTLFDCVEFLNFNITVDQRICVFFVCVFFV